LNKEIQPKYDVDLDAGRKQTKGRMLFNGVGEAHGRIKLAFDQV
jgi:hypothetical protein